MARRRNRRSSEHPEPPPSLLAFLATANYDYVSVLFTTPLGVKMLTITAALQVVGAWIIKKIVAIKV